MKTIHRNPELGYLDNYLWAPKKFIDVAGLKKVFTLAFKDNRSEETRYVFLYREMEHHLLVPRKLWKPEEMPFPVVDCRPLEFERTGITSRIKLDHRWVEGKLIPTGETLQQRAMDALQKADSGILQLKCGAGKTIVALELITRGGGPALVVVDNTNLLEQWKGVIDKVLDVPGGVGLVQGQVFDWKHGIVLSTYHTLGALSEAGLLPEEFKRHFMYVVYEEGHHISARTFAPCAEVIYGYRLALTATPKREDGLHIIYDTHVGPVIFKDIVHEIKARIVFKWTGITVSKDNKEIQDVTGEMHLSKLSSFFGKMPERMSMILNDVKDALNAGRKVMVLTKSVDEAVNLCALWTRQGNSPLYSDIQFPSPAEIGSTVQPLALEKDQREWMESCLKGPLTEAERAKYSQMLEQDDVYRSLLTIYNKRLKDYRDKLLEDLTDAGLMIHKVSPKDRMRFIAEKRVVFAIAKYGWEGLDDEYLDTVLCSMPFSSRNGLQQVMGRPTRRKPGKKEPVLLIYEDNVSALIKMCHILRRHLNSWPVDENGPFSYELRGHHGKVHGPLF